MPDKKNAPELPVAPELTDDSVTFSVADVGLLLRALRFASEKHRYQRRKDREKTPYINHPIEVAERIWNVGGHYDINVVCAALLHDTVEDTDTTIEEISENFGPEIAQLVGEVTDAAGLTKHERRQAQIDHAPGLSHGAKHIKLADKTSNISDISRSQPPEWSDERCIEYLLWTEQVISTIGGVNQALEADYYRALQAAKKSWKV
ncbi:MAG: bifunctional (p)ppGpp synthetase/guanosine-3',5'-bis(diphosphate) 3'-pyrophosphohydrolase [Cyanobacteria bacterium SZAS LIN-2]|nr:bifunctional (p)ppGpp synthetase/guanosine-3',5'-bis(diphosphate) 3'-pyrophosphohydrolase [Cyanobacteria bacterium SZAS LIN-3]MBS1996870.1 bifunctional (p)ppGpp synthetase/guanosine-3',5'-bis(diphosphate) 3'-pyrophosphohydrolase [Cyanobacteria bacterium SZAS LIN-2]MBS2008283.1 bifunctional (p)ppGpp synthetase/guanosine-3',5'-bis(diphosphate) 3'-pyrophosphohydrolase [Cyanobacteria bacterium SZAS TMP-1]